MFFIDRHKDDKLRGNPIYLTVTKLKRQILENSFEKNKNCVSYNISGINNPVKRMKLFGQLKNLWCSIALVQETQLRENT